MQNLFIVLAIATALSSCQNHYTMEISLTDSLSVKHDTIQEFFYSTNDTTAYSEAARRFWTYKSIVKRINIKNKSDRPEPKHFGLYEGQRAILFPQRRVEQLQETAAFRLKKEYEQLVSQPINRNLLEHVNDTAR
jgi:hypothetical protein